MSKPSKAVQAEMKKFDRACIIIAIIAVIMPIVLALIFTGEHHAIN